MMNEDDKWNALFDPRDGDPHHIAANDSNDYFQWPVMVLPGIVVAFAAAVLWCLL